MRALLPAVCFVLIATTAGEPVRISSAYTKLDLDRCVRVDVVEEPESARWRCSGFKEVPLFVQDGDGRHDVDAGREDNDELWATTFDYPGETIEWRLSGGKPFAIIYRLNGANPDVPSTSRLIVETVGRSSQGCRIADIDARTKNANEKARRAADEILSGSVHCLKR